MGWLNVRYDGMEIVMLSLLPDGVMNVFDTVVPYVFSPL
jgi:hypothetical protein